MIILFDLSYYSICLWLNTSCFGSFPFSNNARNISQITSLFPSLCLYPPRGVVDLLWCTDTHPAYRKVNDHKLLLWAVKRFRLLIRGKMTNKVDSMRCIIHGLELILDGYLLLWFVWCSHWSALKDMRNEWIYCIVTEDILATHCCIIFDFGVRIIPYYR